MSETLLIERRGAVEIATLNRPAVLNALNEPMIADLRAYFQGLAEREDVRVVVLRGAGRAFCAGLDLRAWQNTAQRGAIHHGWQVQRGIAKVLQFMRACPQPIIGLGHGAACGGGFSLLLASDVRFGAPSLKMNAAYIKIGLGGADMGSSYFLPRLVGSGLASELLLTGRFLNGKRAEHVGLINELVDEPALLDHGLAFAEEMLANSPMGLRLTKDALNRNLDAPSFEAALAIEDRQQVMMTLSDDYREAIDAFLNKRAPVYRDR
jgi:enoyl-CoA hydratase/carnithine racemase